MIADREAPPAWFNEACRKAASYVKNNRVAVAGLLLASIAPLLALYFVHAFGFNVIYWDEWDYLLLIDKFFTGSLTLAELFRSRNDHIVVIPGLFYLFEASLFHYKTKTLCYLSWLLVTVSIAITGKVFLDQHRGNKYAILLFLPVPFIFFTFKQWESLLFGSTSCEYLGIGGPVLALYALYLSRRADRYFALAIVAGVAGSLSFMTGLLAWPAGLAYLLAAGMKKGIRPGLYWSVAGAANLLWYAFSAHPGSKSYMTDIFANVPWTVKYSVVSAGAFFANSVAEGLFFGTIVALSLAFTLYVVIKNGLVREHAFWLACILFSAGSIVSIVYGRSFQGIESALTSRYLPFTLVGLVGLYLIAAGLFLRAPRGAYARKAAYVLLLLAVAYGIVVGYSGGYHTGEIIKGGSVEYARILYGHDHMGDDQLKLLYPNVTILKERIPIAEKYRLSVFYDGRV